MGMIRKLIRSMGIRVSKPTWKRLIKDMTKDEPEDKEKKSRLGQRKFK